MRARRSCVSRQPSCQRRDGSVAAAVRGDRPAAGYLEQDQLVAFHARLAEERDDTIRQIAGEPIVETAADQQIRCARLAVIDPVDQRLLVACLALGFEMGDRLGREALGEIAMGEVVSRVITRMRARHGGEVEPAQVKPEPFIDLVEEVERADAGRNELRWSFWASTR